MSELPGWAVVLGIFLLFWSIFWFLQWRSARHSLRNLQARHEDLRALLRQITEDSVPTFNWPSEERS